MSVSGVNVVDRQAHLPVGSSCQGPINDNDSDSALWVHGGCRKFCMQCKSATTAIAACTHMLSCLLPLVKAITAECIRASILPLYKIILPIASPIHLLARYSL